MNCCLFCSTLILSFLFANCSAPKKGETTSTAKSPQTPTSRAGISKTHGTQPLEQATRQDFIDELGTPKIAIYINVKKILDYSATSDLMKKHRALFSSTKVLGSNVKIKKCMGLSDDGSDVIVDSFYAFGDGQEGNFAAVIRTTVDAPDYLRCTLKSDREATTTTLSELQAVKTKKGLIFAAAAKHLIIAVNGSYVQKIKATGSTLFRGGARAYFGKTDDVVKIEMTDYPLKNLNKDAVMLMGNVQSLGVNGGITLKNGLFGRFVIDVGNADTASRLVSLVTGILSSPNVNKSLKDMGLDPKIAQSLGLTSVGKIITVSLKLSDTDLKLIAKAIK
ncbi:hypothetical protein KJ865_02540 [Myxococcota bacterium]|nr:hypothetical protein [Myxococcota bacterium]